MKARLNPFGFRVALAAGLCWMTASQSAAQTVTHIAAGDNHTLFTKSDGSLWGMGDNGYGQLGIGSFPAQTNVPQQIVASGVGVIAAGAIHSLFTSGGTLWSMGDNETGALGDGTTNNHYFPEQVFKPGSRFALVGPVAAGSLYSFFGTYSTLIAQSGFWAMGANWTGQLGDGTISEHDSPEEIRSSSSVYTALAVAAGEYHNLYIGLGGGLWATGDEYSGALGDGHTSGYTNTWELIVPSGVTAVAAGTRHSLFVESDGSLWAMGDNEYGQLGDGTTTTRSTPELILSSGVVAVAAGHGHSLFLKSDGSLWAMGENGFGQLGDGSFNLSGVPVRIVASNVVAVAARAWFSLFIKSDGSLWGMGDNNFGQLGDGTYTARPTPIEIVPPPRPSITSIILAGASAVVSWPTNQGGFTLQSASSLTPPVTWSNISIGVIVGNQYVVTNPISGPLTLYRLAE